MADNDRLISIDTTAPQGEQLPAEVQAEINALVQATLAQTPSWTPVQYTIFKYVVDYAAPPVPLEARFDNPDLLQARTVRLSRYTNIGGGTVDGAWVLRQIGAGVGFVVGKYTDPTAVPVLYTATGPAVAKPSPGAGAQYYEIPLAVTSSTPLVIADGASVTIVLHGPYAGE